MLHWVRSGMALALTPAIDPDGDGGAQLLWTIFAILLIAWLLGLVGVYQIGSIVWLLFVAAIIALIIQLATGRRTIV